MNPTQAPTPGTEREAMPCPFCGGEATASATPLFRYHCKSCYSGPLRVWETLMEALDAWNRRVALSAPPLKQEAEAVVPALREFTNELGNRIKITIEGPTSTSENILTPMEVSELSRAIALHSSQPPSSQGEPDMAKDAARVPEGWKLVPLEPTPEMIAAGEDGHSRCDDREIYCAMLAAAPSIDSSMAAAKGEAP